MATLIARWHKSINEFPEHSWKSLAGDETNPFYQWQWLRALEKSESISAREGWQPCHLGIWRENFPIAFAPLYLKGHSYGEFVFDQVFAGLAKELSLNYYPKLIGMSPLSPVEGYRFLYAPGESLEELTKLMMDQIDQFATRNKILSCNFLYVDSAWSSLAEANDCAKWINQKSLWFADGTKNFGEYLQKFNSNQRRNIKRERKAVKDAGIIVSPITESNVNKKVMYIMYNFYQQHCARWGPWGSKYLSESFFQELASSEYKEKVVLFSAHRGDPEDPVAMSLCIKNASMIWGRYWGSKEEINSLHFEVCYYSPISWALDQGITCFDPGAGGSHKLRRGFIAQSNISMHRWYNKQMDLLIRNWLKKVNQMMLEEIEKTNDQLPFNFKAPELSIRI